MKLAEWKKIKYGSSVKHTCMVGAEHERTELLSDILVAFIFMHVFCAALPPFSPDQST